MAITFEDIQKWSGPEMEEKLKNPELKAEIQAVIQKKAEDALEEKQPPM